MRRDEERLVSIREDVVLTTSLCQNRPVNHKQRQIAGELTTHVVLVRSGLQHSGVGAVLVTSSEAGVQNQRGPANRQRAHDFWEMAIEADQLPL